ncbi:LTA synthase family protein [Polaribacter sp. HL-MS24]|uniref:LTA synthase family protein n=1 Tax=Polaribacter sp. HL-MS24 TaxID=3077735 RepID=UPI002934CDDB|nr:sulfatase-like hydrolase/transferase [Polaribacter sp. HL-MS24]WOC40336.1 sulfatase-like hydrolase/transferase [Polaribacter sp. HL-MS24]
MKKIPNYIQLILKNIFCLFLFVFLLRCLFYFFGIDLQDASPEEVKRAFFLGIRFDVKLAVLSFFPLSMLILISNHRFFEKTIFKKINSIYSTAVYLILLLFYVFDFGYHEYLGIRLDASSLRFLSNFKISAQVLYESYPVFKGLFGLLIFGILIHRFSKYLYSSNKRNAALLSKKVKALYFATTFLLLCFGVFNSITHYPLRWSEAFFSKNNKVNQFGLNPVLYFFDSFAFRSEGVVMEDFNKYYPVLAKHLNIPTEKVLFEKKVAFANPFKEKPNVIFVMLESTGTATMSAYGNPLHSTPKMDSILKESLSFSKFYVHKPGTAASVFSSITGLPDIDDVKTVSRNPLAIDQRIIFDQYTGYQKRYFLGGSANWANIRGVFQSNIEGLQIFEEGSFEEEIRADVWGIDDYDLFKESDKELQKLHQNKQPFVAYIQTATNHMPFTVPDQKEEFRRILEHEITDEILLKGGFRSLGQLNGIRYLDFNVARFLKRAQKSGYYNNTIFVFFGDHQGGMKKLNFIHNNEDALEIQRHHVPFFIHAPKYVNTEVLDKYAKLIDIFPTATSIAKMDYTNYTLGRNLLDTSYTDTAAFVYQDSKGERAVGLIKNGYYLEKTNSSKKLSLYRLSDTGVFDVKDKYPLITQRMDSLLSGYYHSTKYLYFNNKKLSK